MANLRNFSDDEQLLIIMALNQEALFNKVAELTGIEHQDIQQTLGLNTGEYIQSLTDDELKEILDTHRHNQLLARQLSNKIKRGINN